VQKALRLAVAVLGLAACDPDAEDEDCVNGQIPPEAYHPSIGPGETRLLSQYPPSGPMKSRDGSSLTLWIKTVCELGECGSAHVVIDDAVIPVPGHAGVTLWYRETPHELSAFNGSSKAITLGVDVTGSFCFYR
jgi:hypothetical protein